MDFCDGGDLRELLNKKENFNGLPEYEIRSILKCLNSAVKYIHGQSLAHRDIKPENIVIKITPRGNIYKLADLGYTKEMMNTIIATNVGTVGYFAPEVLMSSQYSKTVDYWSMGIIAFELICGCGPFIPHQNLPVWAKEIKNKPRNIIAITENNEKVFNHHEHIFKENYVSAIFENMIEVWLQSALDCNPRSRGQTNRVPDQISYTIFSDLDKILNTEVLSVFSLTNYNFSYYEISANMPFSQLKKQISEETSIPEDNLFIILKAEHEIDKVTNETNPKKLLLKNNSDEPMIYVTDTRSTNDLSKVTLNLTDVMNYVITHLDGEFKPFYVLNYFKHVLYFVKNEQRRYKTFLKGLLSYATIVEHYIVKYENEMKKISGVLVLQGVVRTQSYLINCNIEKLREKNVEDRYKDVVDIWTNHFCKMNDEINQLLNASNTLRNRYSSVLKRISDIANINLLKNVDDDYFLVSKLETKYEQFRSKYKEKKNVEEIYDEFLDRWEIRSDLFKKIDLSRILLTLNEIYIEFEHISRIVPNFIQNIDKSCNNIANFIKICNTQLCNIIEEITIQSCKKTEENLSDIMMKSLTLYDNVEDVCNSMLSHITNKSDADITVDETKEILSEYQKLINNINSDGSLPGQNTLPL